MKRWAFACLLVLAAAAPAQRQAVVCVDPGHPSENGVGTKGAKVSELFVAWDVSQRLASLLKKDGIKVVTTKSSKEQKVTNRRRAQIANEAKADIMLRLHCDAGTDRGFATYYPDRTVKLKDRTGPSKQVIQSSYTAGKAFHAAATKSLSGTLLDRGLKTDRNTALGRKGALVGSIYSDRPVLLVEMCVLQNPKDEAVAATEKGRQSLAKALYDGVLAALKVLGVHTS